MQHCRRRRSRRVSFRRPCVKREERNKNSKADKQQEVNVTLCVCCDLAEGSCDRQRADVEAAQWGRNALVKQDQTQQQNETSYREIDRDFPCCRYPITGAPNSDQQKRGNECQLMKRVKEKQVDRHKSTDCATGNEQKTGVECVFIFVDRAGKPDRSQGNDGGKQQHYQTQAVDARCEAQSPFGGYGERGDVLKTAFA